MMAHALPEPLSPTDQTLVEMLVRAIVREMMSAPRVERPSEKD